MHNFAQSENLLVALKGQPRRSLSNLSPVSRSGVYLVGNAVKRGGKPATARQARHLRLVPADDRGTPTRETTRPSELLPSSRLAPRSPEPTSARPTTVELPTRTDVDALLEEIALEKARRDALKARERTDVDDLLEEIALEKARRDALNAPKRTGMDYLFEETPTPERSIEQRQSGPNRLEDRTSALIADKSTISSPARPPVNWHSLARPPLPQTSSASSHHTFSGALCLHCCAAAANSQETSLNALREILYMTGQVLLMVARLIAYGFCGVALILSLIFPSLARSKSFEEKKKEKDEYERERQERDRQRRAEEHERHLISLERNSDLKQIADDVHKMNELARQSIFEERNEILQDDRLIREYNSLAEKVIDGKGDAGSLRRLANEIISHRKDVTNLDHKRKDIDARRRDKECQLARIRDEIRRKEQEQKWDELNSLYRSESSLQQDIRALEADYKAI